MYLLNGSAFNQFEAPFSEASSSAYFSLSLVLFKMLILFRFVLSVYSVLIFVITFSSSDIAVIGSHVSKTDDVLIDHFKNSS